MNGHGHLDRTGEPIEDLPDDEQPPLHDPRCDGQGWVNRDADPAVPCYDCRPHLRPEKLRRALLDADQRRQEQA